MKAWFVALWAALNFCACATVAAHLPSVIAAVTDGVMVLDTIDRFADAYFSSHGADPRTQAKVDGAIERARAALNAALRAAQGAEHLTQEQIDAAFADFRAAYAELLALVAPLGVRQGTGETLRASPGNLVVPEPLALALKVK
jgi:hypothetical protein